MTRLDEIKARAEAATEGPTTSAGQAFVAFHGDLLGKDSLARLIAGIEREAREDIPWLVERVEALTAAWDGVIGDIRALAQWTPEDWRGRGRGGDPIARTINAATDIVEARAELAEDDR